MDNYTDKMTTRDQLAANMMCAMVASGNLHPNHCKEKHRVIKQAYVWVDEFLKYNETKGEVV